MLTQYILIFTLLVPCYGANALTFNQLMGSLEQHPLYLKEVNTSSSLSQKARTASSWGDPMVKVMAKNFPKDTLKKDQSPMTGIEFGISQKIPITTKYSHLGDSMQFMAKSQEYQSKFLLNTLYKDVWEILIQRRKVLAQIEIYQEGLNWLSSNIKITNKLYANGKVGQQALLEMKIRKSELESLLINKKYELEEFEKKSNYYILGNDKKINDKSIPWGLLDKHSSKVEDYKYLALENRVKQSNSKLTAAKLNYIPDLTFSVSYTQRENLDGKGDFVGASVSFPLPLSQTKYSLHKEATYDNYASQSEMKNYTLYKQKELDVLRTQIKKMDEELNILASKTIKFAQNSRTITSKSYGLGNASYLELLQSELTLQMKQLNAIDLISKRDEKKLMLKFVLGEALYE